MTPSRRWQIARQRDGIYHLPLATNAEIHWAVSEEAEPTPILRLTMDDGRVLGCPLTPEALEALARDAAVSTLRIQSGPIHE